MSAPTVGRDYQDTIYLQFSDSNTVKILMRAIGILTWPIVIPLALISRISNIIFRSCSELLAIIPYFPGIMMRYEFYRFCLEKCGSNVLFESGAVFVYRDISIGNDVLIGRYCIVHHCEIGDFVLIGERCTILSGSKQHASSRTDIPMALQGGSKRRIQISDDCWIGSHSIIMDDVSSGSIVAAGSVVTQVVPEKTIVGGVPAKIIGKRDCP